MSKSERSAAEEVSEATQSEATAAPTWEEYEVSDGERRSRMIGQLRLLYAKGRHDLFFGCQEYPPGE